METRLVIAYALIALLAAAAAFGVYRFATRHRRAKAGWHRRHVAGRRARGKY